MQNLPPQPPPKHTQTLAGLLPTETVKEQKLLLAFMGFSYKLKMRSDFLTFTIYLNTNLHSTGLAGTQLCVWYHEMHFHDLSCLHIKKEKSKCLCNIEDQCKTELKN